MTGTSVPHNSPPADARRSERYGARHLLWDLSKLKRVRSCGRVATAIGGVGVKVTSTPAGRCVGFSGLATCGSVWACPVCSAKVAAHRQSEIERALTSWHAGGGRVGLVTLTMRHRKGQSLASLWDAVSDAWHAATSGAGWTLDQDTYGAPFTRRVNSGRRRGEFVTRDRIPTIRVVEVTHGSAGWHVHVHALLLFGSRASAGQVGRVGASMFGRWSGSLVRGGFDAPTFTHGLDARRLEGSPAAALGEYFTKAQYSASMEVTRADLKDAKYGNRTPFSVLRGLVEVHKTGDLGTRTIGDVDQDEALWSEWEAGSKGRRQVAWTPGLRSMLLPDEAELTDEAIADLELGGTVVTRIPAPVWSQIARARADVLVLAAFTISDADGFASLLPFHAAAEQHDRFAYDRAMDKAFLLVV